MIVQITGASTRNKGAELMLRAVREHLRVPESDVTLAVTPWFGNLQDRLKYNLAQKLEWNRWSRTRLAMSLVPRPFLRSVGIFGDEDLDAVIDISGFAFGDQHPAKRTVDFAQQVLHWKKLNKKVILLPQALGPFENPEIREAFQIVLENADLVYARDDASKQHLDVLQPGAANVRQAPDITIGLTRSSTESNGVLVVPNKRMLDKSDKTDSQLYIPLLQNCIRSAQANSEDVAILLHDSQEDRTLIPAISEGLKQPIQVIEESDPVALKKMLAKAKLVIGSRFHALVGALSSGVPVLATGWSHKYEMLLADYQCGESILNLKDNAEDQAQRVTQHLDSSFQQSCRDKLAKAQASLQRANIEMWKEVDETLGITNT